MQLAPLIRDLAVICVVAGAVTLLFQRIRQPVVLGYIIAGILIGPYTPPRPLVSDIPTIRTLAELGVIFLMFSLGLEFSFRRLARAGGPAVLATLVEVGWMMALGYGAGRLLGRSGADSLFLSAVVAISSTTIIIKALGEAGLQRRRFAEFVFSMLIVEDLIAILLLAAISQIASGNGMTVMSAAQTLGQLVLVVGAWVLAGYFLVPRVVRHAGAVRSEETLVILSIGLCLGLVVIATAFGYSAALGAFIMGSIVAESAESRRIETLMHPVRDLFGAIFFVSIGMLLDPSVLLSRSPEVLLLSIVVIGGKAVGVTLGALVSGQSLKRSVLVGTAMTQIGEFSFIIVTLGASLGLISDSLYPVAVAVSLLTTFTTPYAIRLAPRLADGLERAIPARARRILEAYQTGWEKLRSRTWGRDPDFAAHARRWSMSAFVVTLLAVVCSRYGVPVIESQGVDPGTAAIAAWLLGVLAASPFIWSMLTLFRGRVSAAMQFVSLLLFTVLSLSFSPPGLVVGVLLLPMLLVFTRLYRTLERFYRWFEEGFLASFRAGEKQAPRRGDIYRQLAPWDGHLVRLKLHADSRFAGKALKESELRSRHGLNIVVIQRGSRTLVAPRPEEMLFPKDELLVLGPEERIDAARPEIERPDLETLPQPSMAGYDLRQVTVEEGGALAGRCIREAGLREQFGVMVVGIERSGRRLMNPESEERIESGDTLWLVGESSRLDALSLLLRARGSE